MPTVVFDFDKTLTKKDTVLGFLLFATNKNFISLRLLALIFFAVLHKLKLINNDLLKQKGINLFLKDISEETIKLRAKEYASGIGLNDVYRTVFCTQYPTAIIATASFEDYVKPLCKDSLVLGAKLKYTNGKVSGLEQNAYGIQKTALLQEHGIKQIDIFYTDSFSDQPLMDIATEVYLVENDRIKKIKG